MPDEISSKLARAALSEKKAWLRYVEAKGDDWHEAFAEWMEARDASLTAWADEGAVDTGEIVTRADCPAFGVIGVAVRIETAGVERA
jgi:hypothetical protein